MDKLNDLDNVRPGPTPAQVEASRQRLGLPDDWKYLPCSNDCGEIVWVEPDLPDNVDGTPVKAVCSAKCALEVTQSLR